MAPVDLDVEPAQLPHHVRRRGPHIRAGSRASAKAQKDAGASARAPREALDLFHQLKPFIADLNHGRLSKNIFW